MPTGGLIYALAPLTTNGHKIKQNIQDLNVNSNISKLSQSKVFTRAEIAEHATPSSIWVSYLDGVYDITEFIRIHPGGEKILLAAGGPIDPFWDVFSIHKTPETIQLLQNYRIGDLMPLEKDDTAKEAIAVSGLEKLFENEPVRHPDLLIRSHRPCNAEAPPYSLLENDITPSPLFYVRHHLPVPKVDAKTFALEVEGPGIPDGFTITLDQLKNLPKVSKEITLQCAGNRRREMHEIKAVKGLLWQGGAISNAVWTGARLSDVLQLAGFPTPDYVNENYHGVEHVCFDAAEGYGASIPVQKALDPRGDVILAYEMNGEELPLDHGYPLRALVPGHVAARSVKWLSKISLTENESPSHWQQLDYKGFSPSKNLATSDYSQSESIQELPIQSAILDPASGSTATVNDGKVFVQGYAFSGGGRSVNRVDVSADGGLTWYDAELRHRDNVVPGRDWAWTKWEAKVDIPPESLSSGEIEIVCKAVDSSYNVQPDSYEGIYNARGVLVNAWQRIKVNVENKDK